MFRKRINTWSTIILGMGLLVALIIGGAEPLTAAAPTADVGQIAYAGMDENGQAVSVKVINPDGSDDRTLYTLPDVGDIRDVAWHPNGREVGFLASHEAAYSPFFQDVFTVEADGRVRRVSNPPKFGGLPAGYQTGTVRGTLRNGTGVNNINIISLYVQGATAGVQIPIFNHLDEVPFEVEVADLGPGEMQYVYISWSYTGGGPYKEIVAAPVDVMAGQTVDMGLIDFAGSTSQPRLSDLSWNNDGSLAGVLVENGLVSPWGFTGSGELFGTALGDAGRYSTMALSPLGDRMVYYRDTNSTAVIALNSVPATAAAEQIILTDEVASLNYDRHIAWSPDGGTLAITVNGEIFDYVIATETVRQLTSFGGAAQVDRVSLSPSSRYIAFSYSTTAGQSDIYLLDRESAAFETTRLTTDGRSTFPSWSRGEVATQQSLYLPFVVR